MRNKGMGYFSIVTLMMLSVWSARVVAQNLPTITVGPSSQTAVSGTDASFTVEVSGTGPFTYQWYQDGTKLLGDAGIITTVAGGGTGQVLSGGMATNGFLGDIKDIVLDSAENLYILFDSYVYRVDTNGIIDTVVEKTNLYSPTGLALDRAGNLFIADRTHIWKRDTNGVMTSVAGNGSMYFSGDGGLATNAGGIFASVATDEMGNLFALGSSRILKVDTNGVITSVAGNGTTATNAGDGVIATEIGIRPYGALFVDQDGRIFFPDRNRIRQVDTNGIVSTVAGCYSYPFRHNEPCFFFGDGGKAIHAGLGLRTDSSARSGFVKSPKGDLIFSDRGNCRIRKVDTHGIITTIAGNGTVVYYGDDGVMATNTGVSVPSSLALSASGDLYVACYPRVRKISLRGGPTHTVSRVGEGDSGNYYVVVGNSYGSVTSQVATLSVLFPPAGVISPQSQVLTEGKDHTFAVSASGTVPLSYQWRFNGTNIAWATNQSMVLTNARAENAGSYDVVVSNVAGVAAIGQAVLGLPPCIVSVPPSNVITVAGNNEALKLGAGGDGRFTYGWFRDGAPLAPMITTVAGNGLAGSSGDGGAATNAAISPNGIACDGFGNVYIRDSVSNFVRKVDTNGIITEIPGTTNGYALAVDKTGNVFVGGGKFVNKIDRDGTVSIYAGSGIATNSIMDGVYATNAGFSGITCLATDDGGNLYVVDWGQYRIHKIDTNGIVRTVMGKTCPDPIYPGDNIVATNVGLWVLALACDKMGNLYINDSQLYIRKVGTDGFISTLVDNRWETAEFKGFFVNGIAADELGNVYLSDSDHNRILRVDANGDVTPVAGLGTAGFSGDGGAATNASLNRPINLAVDSHGNLLIGDDRNRRVRKVDFFNSPELKLNESGIYSAVVSSPFGSVTNLGTQVLVVDPVSSSVAPRLGSAASAPGEVKLRFTTRAGYKYVVECADSIDSSNWHPVMEIPASFTDGEIDLPQPTTNVTRFYRAVISNK